MFGKKKQFGAQRLAPTQPLTPIPQVSVAERDGSAVLMDLRSGHYFGLDSVGTRIWQLVAQHKTPTEIFRVIEAEYDAPREQLRADTTRFLTSILALGLASQ